MTFDDSKVSYEVTAEYDHAPVVGNAMCSGDPAYDAEVEDSIIARCNAGDVWAWACVKVTARYDGIDCVEGVDYLGCCSYASEADFMQPGGYFDDMKAVALADLADKLDAIVTALTKGGG
jgi:hypothetical protein